MEMANAKESPVNNPYITSLSCLFLSCEVAISEDELTNWDSDSKLNYIKC